MPMWEYMQLTWSEQVSVDPRIGSGKVMVYQMNGMHVRDASEMKIADFLNALGGQGWEMVGCGNISAERHCLYFKRLRAQ